MKKKLDLTPNDKYTGDVTVERGYVIYDEWNSKNLSSKEIVNRVESAVDSVGISATADARAEALSYLFALDMRIREKYSSLLRRILSYFSWRRETYVFKQLSLALHIPYGKGNIRDAIEAELQRIREGIGAQESEGSDDETHGGKHNGSVDEEIAASEEKQQDGDVEERAEESTDIEENNELSEDRAEERSEQISHGENIEKQEAQQASAEEQIEDAEPSAHNENEQDIQEEFFSIQEEISTSKNDNNGINVANDEPITDKNKESTANNEMLDAFDPFIGEEGNEKSKSISFIDEMIIDLRVRNKDIIGYVPIDEARQYENSDRTQDTVLHQNEGNKGVEGDDIMYDKMSVTDRGETDRVGSEQLSEPMQSNGIETVKQETTSLGEMLQTDINADLENQLINELNNTISKESVREIYRMQSEVMREQLSIASEELGINTPVEIIGKPDEIQVNPSDAELNRK